jgi:hypothetical protein
MRAASEFIISRRRRRRRRRRRPRREETTTTTKCLSPLQKWFVHHIESMGVDAWERLNEYNVTSLAYYYKHHVSGDDGAGEYFGAYGERTDDMLANHEALTRFWSSAAAEAEAEAEAGSSSSSSNVVLLGMHGMDLADDDKLLATLQQMHRMDYSAAEYLRMEIREIIESLPDGYANPLLTANAMAIQSLDPIDNISERDSIIIGDGIFEFLDFLDLGDGGGGGVSYIHSHEFGHHLQYDLDVDEIGGVGSIPTNVAVVTRWWEMMADTFGSYFNAHARGGDMDDATLLDVHRAAFSMGDCESSIGTHHGLPRQRECASGYGADLALISHYDGGVVMPPSRLRDLFNEKYERLVRLDAEQCTAVVDESTLDADVYGEVSYDSSDSTSYLDGFTFGIHETDQTSAFGMSELDRPPPILQDENGTVITKEEKGFWGENTWIISEPASYAAAAAAVGRLGMGLTFVASALAYYVLLC